MSSLTAKYREFVHLSQFLVRIWLYATPIIYSLSSVPEEWRWAAALNPMTAVVESYRYALLGKGTVEAGHIGVSALMTIVILVSGLFLFSRTERDFIDTA